MAGIVGCIAAKGHTFGDISRLITAMREEITYTGAERFDQWSNEGCAVVRVHHGILNPTPQPLFNEDRSLCIVMDGEVFDYGLEKQRLIQRGHQFRFDKTDSDAEYCLHLYEEYGPAAFAELNGSFLIALYDLHSHELLLVNDRLSSRPLFYFCDKEQLVFGNQLRPLLKFQDLPRRLDLRSIFDFFAFQRIFGDRTFYQDVKALPPASILRFRDGNLSLDRYWKMQYADEARSERYYVEALSDALREAVTSRTRGDHRLGILLSGGLDSRVVISAESEGKFSIAFTLGDFLNEEVRIAQQVASARGCKHIFFQRGPDYYVRLVEEAVDIGDGMSRFDHAHFLGYMTKMREESDILLHGHWFGSLLRGGYLPRVELRVASKRASLPILQRVSLATLPTVLVDKSKHSTAAAHPERLFQGSLSNQFRDSVYSSVEETLRDETVYGSNVYNALDYFGIHSYFRTISSLNFLCIRAYIDERAVVLDNDLLNLHLSMPPQLRLGRKVYRKAFRKIVPSDLLAVPDANTGLPADMPTSLVVMLTLGRAALRNILPAPQLPHPSSTSGSWPNFTALIRHNEQLNRLMWETLHDPECIDPGLFNVKAIDSIFEKHINGEITDRTQESKFTQLMLLLLTFGRWHKKYGPNS